MSLTVRDIIKLENLSNFKIVAGKDGLDRIVNSTGIVDFEFIPNLSLNRPVMFDENSFVVSSLLFAQGNVEILYDSIKSLIGMGVSGLAYKDVIFKELPQDVINLSNSENFPIFVFNDSIYFEDVITDVAIAIREDSQLTIMEIKLRDLVQQNYSPDDVKSVSEMLFPNFYEYVAVFLCSARDSKSQSRIDRAYRNYIINKKNAYNLAICTYGKHLMILISNQHQENKKYLSVFNDVLFNCKLLRTDINFGYSTIKQSRLELDVALRESTYALRACDIIKREELGFSDIGIYQFLLPCEENIYLQKFAKGYLDLLISEDTEQNRKNMETAVAYVFNRGQLKEMAKQLNVHENTARYRISKLKEILDPNETEHEFFANLNLAVRLHVLKK